MASSFPLCCECQHSLLVLLLSLGQNQEITREKLGGPFILSTCPQGWACGGFGSDREDRCEWFRGPTAFPLVHVGAGGVERGYRVKRSHFPGLSLEHASLSLSPYSEFGLLPELFPRVVSSLACLQVWMFCQHSREFMIACRCASKNTLYPKQKLMQA